MMTTSARKKRPQVLVLGSGISGLSCALKLSAFANVTLLTKESLEESNTLYAQGGIAAVWSENDSFESHIEDTIKAGVGLCHSDTVEVCVKEGPTRVQELIDGGVEFIRDNSKDARGGFSLHREGGHNARRILHNNDQSGRAVELSLVKQVRAAKHIEILEHHAAIDLIMEAKLRGKKWRRSGLGRCLGAYVLNTKTGLIQPFAADLTVLATGGAGKVYLYTTNPDVATGDGIAMAYRAGAKIANMEFTQFHPTCLYHPHAKNFLVTEALRGEGAILRNHAGEDFMKAQHDLGSLAPRDIVARSIDVMMKKTGEAHVWLDISAISKANFAKKFPLVSEVLKKFEIDPYENGIPVVPAAHYLCGGVVTDLNGLTSVSGLAAIGEASCSGLHGANRLASNSLLEGLVFAHRLAEWARSELEPIGLGEEAENLPVWDFGRARDIEEQIDVSAIWREIRTLMWNYVGIVRSDRKLSRARDRLALIRHEVNEDYWKFRVNRDMLELRNLLTVAELMVQSAQSRKESRGAHYNIDYPKRDDTYFSHDTLI